MKARADDGCHDVLHGASSWIVRADADRVLLLAALQQVTAERDTAQATVARVRAIGDEYPDWQEAKADHLIPWSKVTAALDADPGPGCCTACDPATGEPCTDCLGTGHTHEAGTPCRKVSG
jgi:hypothetical protein